MKRWLPISMLALAPLFAHAAGGAYEINQDCAAVGCFADDAPGFPIVINTPGSYVLTSDIHVTLDGAIGIQINTSAVDLDLNHHIVDGGGSCTGNPVTGCTPGHGTIGIFQGTGASAPGVFRIHDGIVKGFTNTTSTPYGIFLDDARGVIVERVTVTETAGSCAITTGTDTLGGTLKLREVSSIRNLSYGACPLTTGTPTSFLASIENSDFSGNGLYGVASFPVMTIVGSRFSDNGSYGINATGSTVALGASTFTGNNGGAAQYTITTLRDMAGNVCTDHMPCP